MLKLTSAALDAFRVHLEAREYSPATVAKYVHDVRALMDYAPEGLAGKAQLNGFRSFLEAKGYSGSSAGPSCPTTRNCPRPNTSGWSGLPKRRATTGWR